MNLPIQNPAAAAILSAYGATTEDPGVHGLLIIHFPSLGSATAWAEACEVDNDTAVIRDWNGLRGPCKVMYHIPSR